MDDPIQHRLTVTYRERSFNGQESERSYVLEGSPEAIGAAMAESITRAVRYGHGPMTLVPLHPAAVIRCAEPAGNNS